MKVWTGYGSEHSWNLVMIGRFEQVREAEAAKELIDEFVKKATEELEAGRLQMGEPQGHFSEEMQAFLRERRTHCLGPGEVEQFAYDVTVRQAGNTVELKTNEVDVSAFLKLLIDQKARVEVFSAHHHSHDKADPQ
jgi:hypothetical protein